MYDHWRVFKGEKIYAFSALKIKSAGVIFSKMKTKYSVRVKFVKLGLVMTAIYLCKFIPVLMTSREFENEIRKE